jgi:molybdate transport system regulatory protein
LHEKKTRARQALGRRPCPTSEFDVAEGVKFLDAVRLEALTESFRAWAHSPARPTTRLSRTRVWLIYLLLRYTGARLGEVLALDELRDIDLERGVVRFGGDKDGEALAREILLPDEVARALSVFLNDPAAASLRGAALRMDGGYIRRKFYERAAACSIPQELANPRVLRHTRAIELLRSGAPLPVVQNILGHSSVNLTAQYLSFPDEDIRAIVHYYLNKEKRMKTSARNAFYGKVTRLVADQLLAEVEITTAGGHQIVSVITKESMRNLGISVGLPLIATVKAPMVIVVKESDEQKTSMRNRLKGAVVRISEGAVAAEVVVLLEDGTEVCALITEESVKKLDLKPGDVVWTMFKAFSVVLNAD